MSSGSGKVVCVTGASGFIASWIVKFLLLHGYTVRATVRDPSNPKKVDHLLRLDGAREGLQLFKADLVEEGSFDFAIEGCDGVFHAASPVQISCKDPQAELIDPAVKGTLNVLKSCAKSPSVKRVVLTSSAVSVLYNGRPRSPDVVVDETWFTNPDFCMEHKMWYPLAKTTAENVAREYVKENNIDLVFINPTVTIGPLLQPELNSSVSLISDLVNGINFSDAKFKRDQFRSFLFIGKGKPCEEIFHLIDASSQTFPNTSFGWVNVKDVANAHIQAYEIASANGRYCLFERVAHFSEVVKMLHDIYPTITVPEKCADDKTYMPTFQVSKEKAKSLGIEFIPLEVSLKETLESLKEKNFVSF